MRRSGWFAVFAALGFATVASAQEGPFQVEKVSEAAPGDLAAPIREALEPTGLRVVDAQGKPFFEIWLRKGIPATGKPAGPKDAVQFPVLEAGTLVGAIRFDSEGYDFRDQPIEPAAYTLRYGLQPVNGDHLGVSPFRDYVMLLTAAHDQKVDLLAQEHLDKHSAEAAGTNHPAIFLLLDGKGQEAGSIQRDEANDRWGVVLNLPLAVKGENAPAALPIQMIFLGKGPS
jgi:hypothetical protein